MGKTDTKPKTGDPLGREHRCTDFDNDCKDVPGVAPDGFVRSHLTCWLYDPTRGWCPFLRDDHVQ
ncbi:hypothetical protein ACVMGC_011517 [Bradyrhizobium barranii subsp. barranii]|uniref:Uncharacterized protein n=1 Tax=Bradyrhizobium barranii subsp. barranii TaxID=2823807 RepID=A0A939MBM5_9BRAD|nr:hypothetical protein [Bradyrhizobium barranii]UEM08581.1 hypothetical protein J4G43_027820 [Bradyrhizobium barranii subsp. barranii]